MRAAVYLRISEDREGRELGVDRQRADCMALAKRLGHDVIDVYVDNDISASAKARKARPDYGRLVADARAGRFTVVIAYSSSRLTRQPREHEDQIDLATDHGIRYAYVVSPSFDLNTAAGRQVARILAANDAGESEQTSERVKAAVRQRAERGKCHGGLRAFGYTADGMSLVDSEAADLKRWYDELLAGRSISAIAREAGKHHASMRAIFANPRNAALRVLDAVEYPSPWPAVVPLATWRAVASLMRDPARRVNHSGGKRKWLGSGLYGCERCDGRKVGIGYNGAANGGRALYRCVPVTGGCGRVWRAVELDDYVSLVVEQRLRRSDLAELLPQHRPDLDALHAERKAVRTALDRAAALWAIGEMDDGEREAASRSGRARLAEIDARLGESRQDGALARLLTFADPAQAWLDTPVEEVEIRQGIVRTLMTVTLGPSPRGGQEWYAPTFVRIDFH